MSRALRDLEAKGGGRGGRARRWDDRKPKRRPWVRRPEEQRSDNPDKSLPLALALKLMRGGSSRAAARFGRLHNATLLHAGGAMLAGSLGSAATAHPAPLAAAASFTHGVAHLSGRLKRAANYLAGRQRGLRFGRNRRPRQGSYR